MKTERQVKNILATVDERIVDCFRRKAEEYTEEHNKATNDAHRDCYTLMTLALMDIAYELGYDWHKDIDDGVKRAQLNTVDVVRHKVTEGF